MNRETYNAWKRKEIDRLEFEAEACERQLEAIHIRLMRLEEETYEEATADDRYDEWKARRIEILNDKEYQ